MSRETRLEVAFEFPDRAVKVKLYYRAILTRNKMAASVSDSMAGAVWSER